MGNAIGFCFQFQMVRFTIGIEFQFGIDKRFNEDLLDRWVELVF